MANDTRSTGEDTECAQCGALEARVELLETRVELLFGIMAPHIRPESLRHLHLVRTNGCEA